MTYTPLTQRQWRERKGPPSKKLTDELTLIKTEYDAKAADADLTTEITKRENSSFIIMIDSGAMADGDHVIGPVFPRDIVITDFTVQEDDQTTDATGDVFKLVTGTFGSPATISATAITISSASGDNPGSSSFDEFTLSAGSYVAVNVDAASSNEGTSSTYVIGYNVE